MANKASAMNGKNGSGITGFPSGSIMMTSFGPEDFEGSNSVFRLDAGDAADEDEDAAEGEALAGEKQEQS